MSYLIDEAFCAVSVFFQKPDVYRRDQRLQLRTDDAFVRNILLPVQIKFLHLIECSYSSLPPFSLIIPEMILYSNGFIHGRAMIRAGNNDTSLIRSPVVRKAGRLDSYGGGASHRPVLVLQNNTG